MFEVFVFCQFCAWSLFWAWTIVEEFREVVRCMRGDCGAWSHWLPEQGADVMVSGFGHTARRGRPYCAPA